MAIQYNAYKNKAGGVVGAIPQKIWVIIFLNDIHAPATLQKLDIGCLKYITDKARGVVGVTLMVWVSIFCKGKNDT